MQMAMGERLAYGRWIHRSSVQLGLRVRAADFHLDDPSELLQMSLP